MESSSQVQDAIKVSGYILKFNESYLEVQSRSLLKRERDIVLWDTVNKIVTTSKCFSHTIQMTTTTGQIFVFSCSARTFQIAAKALYRFVGRSKGPVHNAKIRPPSKQALAKHRTATLYDVGMILKKSNGFCNYSLNFVPWASIISVTLSPNRKAVIVRTVVSPEFKATEDADSPEGLDKPALTGQAGSQAAKATAKAKATANAAAKSTSVGNESQKGQSGTKVVTASGDKDEDDAGHIEKGEEELGIVRIRGNQAVSEALFKEMVYMMSDGNEEAPKEEIRTKTATAQVMQTGLLVHRKGGCFPKGIERYFVPWSSLERLTWRPAGVLTKTTLVVSDLTGCALKLRGVELREFNKFREAFSEGTSEAESSNAEGDASPMQMKGGAKGLKLSLEGALIETGTCCGGPCACFKPQGRVHNFVPWARIDGCELSLGFFRGTAVIITEGGQRIRVGSASTVKLWNIFERVHAMKYGANTPVTMATFNRRGTVEAASTLTTQSVRVVTRSRVREFDLERIVGCCTTKGFRNHNGMLMCVQTGPGQREVLKIPIKNAAGSRGESLNARELARLVLVGAAVRKRQEASAAIRAAAAARVREERSKREREARDPSPSVTRSEPQALPASEPAHRPSETRGLAPATSALSAGVAKAEELPPEDTIPAALETNEPVSEAPFKVVLQNDESENTKNCGILSFLRKSPSGNQCALYIETVSEGPVTKWNKSSGSDLVVQPGDYIISVNGESNDPISMLSGLQQIGKVELMVTRKWTTA